ncbi:hypothetical protein E4U47_000181 [Claviceps purpurea]|nr:hypothetical protein E4U47_000181 [Claviceps purpurea]
MAKFVPGHANGPAIAKQQFDRWDTVTAEAVAASNGINIGRPLESGSGGKPKSTGENTYSWVKRLKKVTHYI